MHSCSELWREPRQIWMCSSALRLIRYCHFNITATLPTALLIAPLLGLLVAALFKGLFFWKHYPYRRLALFGMMGAITHGLIDACTSYGTLLYWPISHHRESWDIISIIDPIFTLPLVLLTVIAFIFRRPRFAQFAVALCLIYLSLGIYQRGQATQIAAQIAEERDHRPEELSVRPSLANILLWRIVYRSRRSVLRRCRADHALFRAEAIPRKYRPCLQRSVGSDDSARRFSLSL